MAKKVLTPEEVQAKLEKKAAKRKLFFGTFTKALAFFLAIAMVYSLAVIAFTPTVLSSAINNGAVQSGDSSDNGFDDYDDGSSDYDDGSSNSGDSSSDDGSSNSGDSSSNSGSNNSGSNSSGSNNAGNSGSNNSGSNNAGSNNAGSNNAGNSGAPQDDKKAAAAKAINDATAKAVSAGNYNWTRKCYYTQPLDVGDATATLNTVIGFVDKNASIDSVVGGFLGITGKANEEPWSAPVTGGAFPADRNFNETETQKYLMKKFALTANDIETCEEKDGTYTITLKSCNRPQKDNKNALHHVTNDFITQTEVSTSIKDALGAAASLARLTIKDIDVDFTNIKVVAKIDNGTLKKVDISYTMTVKKLTMSALGTNIEGTGAGNLECSYTF